MTMTPQEQEKLQQFLSQLKQAGGVQRDPEADAMINATVSRQPDAAYLLVQRTLLQDQALEAAQARIAELERQAQAARPASSGSFLGGADTWGNSARSAPASAGAYPERASTLGADSYPQAGQAAYPQAGQGAYPQGQVPYPGQRQGGWSRFGGGMGGMGGGGGSFLGTMAATAAGVAGGAFLFHGIDNLLHNHQGNDAGQQHGLTSDAGAGQSAAADSSLAQDAGLNDIGTAPAQEAQDYGVADNNVAFDNGGMSDDFGGGDDSMI
jgi:hypothetical protein